MDINDFLALSYLDQLRMVIACGSLKNTCVLDNYQFTLYEVKGIYVELKRNVRKLSFETIIAMRYDELPGIYK